MSSTNDFGIPDYAMASIPENYFQNIPTLQEQMAKLIDIEKNLPHKVSEVICIGCGQRWIALRPTRTLLKDLECSNCGKGKVIETGEIMEEK